MAKQFLESIAALSLLAGSFIAFSSAAEAAKMTGIEFEDMNIQGGIVSYDGEGGSLTATDLLLDAVIGIETPRKIGVLSCVKCILNAETGDNISESPYQFAPGGSVTITGTVKRTAKNGLTKIIATDTLLSGYFTENVTGSASINGAFVGGVGWATINRGIISHFGIDTPKFTFGKTILAFDNVDINDSNGGFTATVTNVDMNNRPIRPEENSPIGPVENSPVSVPEPATLLGICVVSAGLAVSRRRSITKQ